jgi:hypothetical protein
MKIKHFIFFAVAMAIAFLAHPAAAANSRQPPELFDVPLKGAQRDQLRAVFKKAGMKPVRENDSFWIDIYNAKAVVH